MATLEAEAPFLHLCHLSGSPGIWDCNSCPKSFLLSSLYYNQSASPIDSSISPICLPPLPLDCYFTTSGSQLLLIWTVFSSLASPSSICLIHCWPISKVSWCYYPAETTILVLHCPRDKVQILLVHGTRPSMPWPPTTTPAWSHLMPSVVVAYVLNLPDNSANQVACCRPLDHAALSA